MIRVNHAGEYGAKRIYAGQLAVLGRRPVGHVLRAMAAQEQTLHQLMTARAAYGQAFLATVDEIEANDPKAAEELVKLLQRQKGWERVVHKGDDNTLVIKAEGQDGHFWRANEPMEAFKTFDIAFVMTGQPSAELISSRLYKMAFQEWQTGKSCALAYIVLIMVLCITNIYVKYLNKAKER